MCDAMVSSVGLIDEQERLCGSSEQSGDNGKGKESEGDEGRSDEVDLLEGGGKGDFHLNAIKVRSWCHEWDNVDDDEDDDQARPGVEGVVVEEGEARGDRDRNKVLESAHSCIDLPKVCRWYQL